MMLVASFDGRIVAVNPAWTRCSAGARPSCVGRSLPRARPPRRPRRHAGRGWRTSPRGATTFKFENRYRRSDGGYASCRGPRCRTTRFIHAVGRDVTADRAAAEALKPTESALQQAQKMEAIGQLTGGVAHDFNNLLQVISRQPAAAGARRGRQRARRSARVEQRAGAASTRGAKLASQLLAFARRQPLEPKVVNLGRLRRGMDDMLRRALGEAIEIETVVAGGLWNTLVDPTQVENAMLNLAINARDAMDGRGKLTIEVGNAVLDDAYARAHAEVERGPVRDARGHRHRQRHDAPR